MCPQAACCTFGRVGCGVRRDAGRDVERVELRTGCSEWMEIVCAQADGLQRSRSMCGRTGRARRFPGG
eukprot:2439667-Prymnesium_polylepis.1